MPQHSGMPNQGPQQQGGLQGERSVQTESQLLQNLITKLGVEMPDDASLHEIGDYLATGFCEQEEIDLLGDYQYQLKQIRGIKNRLGLDPEELTSVEYEIVARMITISQLSKSKGGRGIQAVKTEIVHQMQDLYEKQEMGQEEKGIIDKFSEALEGKQVTGDVNTGNYYSNQREANF